MHSPTSAHKRLARHGVARLLRRGAISAAVLTAFGGAHATDIDTGNSDITLRWDNTVKYSNAFRLKSADPALVSAPTSANADDGDRNFGKGLISNRLDLLSELDVSYQRRYGARISAAGWYDSVYNKSNDNPGFAGGAFPNHAVVPGVAANEFTPATRRLMGRKTEVLDTFVFGKFDLGESTASFRLGKHTLLWGESLFFGANAIAGGQAPVDVIKALSVPNSQFKEFLMPVPQVSAQFQVNAALSVGAYYQFRWVPTRLPAAGSYFSITDTVGDGAERILLPGGLAAARLADQRGKDSGQGGVQLKYRTGGNDFGLYAIRFHNKTPQLVVNLTPGSAPLPASYQLAYQNGITAFGASISRTIGDFNVAAEASMRHNQDLASQNADLSALGLGAPSNNGSNPAYAVGKTAHFNLSTLASLPSNPLWNEATLAAEFAWNRALSVTKNAAAIDPMSTRDAWSIRGVLEPTYRQVLPSLDIGVPIGLGYTPSNAKSRALGPGPFAPAGGGDISIGLNGNYMERWKLSLSMTHYLGDAAPITVAVPGSPTGAQMYSYQQTAKDRDFIAFSVSTTF